MSSCLGEFFLAWLGFVQSFGSKYKWFVWFTWSLLFQLILILFP